MVSFALVFGIGAKSFMVQKFSRFKTFIFKTLVLLIHTFTVFFGLSFIFAGWIVSWR